MKRRFFIEEKKTDYFLTLSVSFLSSISLSPQLVKADSYSPKLGCALDFFLEKWMDQLVFLFLVQSKNKFRYTLAVCK